MGNRISAVVTRTGDDGSTGLSAGRRVWKCSLVISALGDIDELNSYLGLCICAGVEGLDLVQQKLFDLGGCVSLEVDYIASLDNLEFVIAQLNAQLPPLREFIMPGGNYSSSHLHIARTVCRRAERALVRLGTCYGGVKYLNRLSDYLFILARSVNDIAEKQWEH